MDWNEELRKYIEKTTAPFNGQGRHLLIDDKSGRLPRELYEKLAQEVQAMVREAKPL